MKLRKRVVEENLARIKYKNDHDNMVDIDKERNLYRLKC
jgi:hypothetical protein